MTKMTRKKAREISDSMMPKIRKAAAALGVEVERGAGRYDPEQGTVAFRLTFKLPVEAEDFNDHIDIICGRARRGHRVRFLGRPGKPQFVIIEKARRTKYSFHFEDEPSKTYTARFEAFASADSNAGQPKRETSKG